jgi:hypothetical protein
VLVKSVESQAAVASKIGQLVTDNVVALTEMQKNAYQRASRRRGGKIRANSAQRTKAGRFARGCRLCENPSVSDPTRDEIIAHTNHLSPGYNFRLDGDKLHADVDETQIAPDGSIECQECAQGIPHEHGRN